MEPKQVIIVRRDTEPKMRMGKVAAQVAHASLAVLLNHFFGEYKNRHLRPTETIEGSKIKKYYRTEIWLPEDDPIIQWINNSFVKVVVKGTLSDVVEAYNEAKKQGIPCSLIEDKGLTEFGGKVTITCCAIGPDDPEKIDKITGHLELL